ncbi:glycosyltransferase family 2 protein [Desulfosediminicola sp.]|uniref:glycosyltransferase family 2 protein n=1 Tax=Desulfosediminicola sp. TaxID=2886825 RepID=UPI003AF29E3E
MKKSRALISVIIPVYNVERYIGDCMESVLQQSYSHIEIICVNDGSTDSSGEILERYAQRDSRITVVYQRNKGLSQARNAGIGKAKGEYFFFLDSDDWIHAKALEVLILAALKKDVKVASCGVLKVEQKSGESKKYRPNRKVGMLSTCGHNVYSLEPMVWNKIYHSSVFDKIRFMPGIVHEDEEIYWKIFSDVESVYAVDDYLVNYRIHDHSITQRKKYSEAYQLNYMAIIDTAFRCCSDSKRKSMEVSLCAVGFYKVMQRKKIPSNLYLKHISSTYGVRMCYLGIKMLKLKVKTGRFLQFLEDKFKVMLSYSKITA